ncbi:MAG TPA: tetratricopeptide repeat protein [Polyangia bacterium]|nr:tetratricopeptide repeat protein [Polyangia bacterium]
MTGGLTARAITIGITGAIAGAIAGASAIGCLAAAPPTAGRAGMAEQRGQAFRQHLDAGMAALKAGTFAAAERRFAAAAELEPRAPEPRLLAAVAAERQFHHGAAAAWLRGAVAEAPWRADARAMLVSVLLRADKLAEAAAELGALRAHGGADERLLIELQAAVHFRAHRYDQAVAEFSRLLARRADDPVGLCGFGVVRAVAGDLAGAESALARARAAAPTLALADYNLALVHYYAGRFDQAARASEDALRKDPSFLPAMTNLAASYLKLGRGAAAELVLQRALAQAGAYAPALANLGVLAYDRGRFDEAARMLGEAVRLAPRTSSIHYNLGVLAYRQGRFPEAAREFGEALRLDPKNADAARNQRWIQDLMGGAKGGVDLPRPQAKLVVGEFSSS